MNWRVDNVDVRLDVYAEFDRHTIQFSFVPTGPDDPLVVMLLKRHREYLDSLPPDDHVSWSLM